MRIRARHYQSGERVDVLCHAGQIQSVGPATTEPCDLSANWVAPALFDLQINGCLGHGFSSETLREPDVQMIVATCRQHGIAAFCPTLITSSFDTLVIAFRALRRMRENDHRLARAMPVFHLEGPYISPEDGPRGAHPREHVRRPSLDEFEQLQEAAGGLIRLVTLAPEAEGALPFIESLTRRGVVVALGHTAAAGQVIRDAIAAGARLSTHLGNGCHAMLPRHANPIWEQLASDDMWASIICDGQHLPPSVVRCFLRVKGPSRLVLTCDASSLAGLPPGRYSEWGQELDILPEGKIIVAQSSYLAGSWSFTDRCVGNVMATGEVQLQEALDMAGKMPRELLGLPPQSLEAGSSAELILFDLTPECHLEIRATIIGDEVVRHTSPKR